MKWKISPIPLVIVVAVSLCTVGTVTANASQSKAGKQVRISKLSAQVQKALRKGGVVGPTLNLVGSPDLQGSVVDGLSLYQSGWVNGGVCISGVIAGHPDGADCGAMFTTSAPGYATAGPLQPTITGPAAPGQLPPQKLTILQVYGVATTTIKSVRLIGPESGTTPIPVKPGVSGYVVFGLSDPPPDGKVVDLLNASGDVVQTIRIA